MHQLGLTATDLTVLLKQALEKAGDSLDGFEAANIHAGMAPERAARQAMVDYMHAFAETVITANNRKIAADLVRLGVLTGTLTRGGEATF